MDVTAVLVEQLDLNGTLRTFRMKSDNDEQITIAFANEYDQLRSGPFHFLERQREHSFDTGFAECVRRHVSKDRFKRIGRTEYEFNTSWFGITTERQRLSYYALSLPEYAIPKQVRFSDPRTPREFNKKVQRDLQRNRFILYLECRSSHGSFDFVLHTIFSVSKEDFQSAEYQDRTSTEYGVNHDMYRQHLNRGQQRLVQQFFVNSEINMAQYNTGQAGAVGPYSSVGRNKNQQNWDKEASGIDFLTLVDELQKLQLALREKVTEPEYCKALASVTCAAEAADKKDRATVMQHLKAAGKWTLDIATKIGTTVAARVIAEAMRR